MRFKEPPFQAQLVDRQLKEFNDVLCFPHAEPLLLERVFAKFRWMPEADDARLQPEGLR
jgi:hypothetical protein